VVFSSPTQPHSNTRQLHLKPPVHPMHFVFSQATGSEEPQNNRKVSFLVLYN